jgi:hypothetical protein
MVMRNPVGVVKNFQNAEKPCLIVMNHGAFQPINSHIAGVKKSNGGWVKNGTLGLTTGFGRGIGGLVFKTGTAVAGIPEY